MIKAARKLVGIKDVAASAADTCCSCTDCKQVDYETYNSNLLEHASQNNVCNHQNSYDHICQLSICVQFYFFVVPGFLNPKISLTQASSKSL